VGAAEFEEDNEPHEERMSRLMSALREQRRELANLDETIDKSLRSIGFGV
jgi:type I restriction enzyme M protein